MLTVLFDLTTGLFCLFSHQWRFQYSIAGLYDNRSPTQSTSRSSRTSAARWFYVTAPTLLTWGSTVTQAARPTGRRGGETRCTPCVTPPHVWATSTARCCFCCCVTAPMLTLAWTEGILWRPILTLCVAAGAGLKTTRWRRARRSERGDRKARKRGAAAAARRMPPFPPRTRATSLGGASRSPRPAATSGASDDVSASELIIDVRRMCRILGFMSLSSQHLCAKALQRGWRRYHRHHRHRRRNGRRRGRRSDGVTAGLRRALREVEKYTLVVPSLRRSCAVVCGVTVDVTSATCISCLCHAAHQRCHGQLVTSYTPGVMLGTFQTRSHVRFMNESARAKSEEVDSWWRHGQLVTSWTACGVMDSLWRHGQLVTSYARAVMLHAQNVLCSIH